MQIPPKPGHIHTLEFVRILTPYVLAHDIVKGKTVLELGCGLGYGVWLLVTGGASRVVALDLDKAKIFHTVGSCPYVNSGRLCAIVADGQALPFRDCSFQVVTNFEVIEHVSEPFSLLSELARVLRTDGILLLTTPNRSARLFPLQRPWNPEHMREYTFRALQKGLREFFPSFKILGIYGNPELHKFYKMMWKRTASQYYRDRVLRVIRIAIPSFVRTWIKNLYHHNISSPKLSLDIAIPASIPGDWPFYIDDVTKDCLGFFAICGFDNRFVCQVTNGIKRLG